MIKVAKLLYTLAFGKGTMLVCAGKNVIGAAVCLYYSHATTSEAMLSILPWLGCLALDVAWYALGKILRQVDVAKPGRRWLLVPSFSGGSHVTAADGV